MTSLGSPTKSNNRNMSDSTNIKVLVRVRPLLPREFSSSCNSLISMPESDSKATILKVPVDSAYHSQRTKVISKQDYSPSDESKHYSFDESIWSFDKQNANYINNVNFYHKTGPEIINHFFQGFNVCLLAYGQTSSGKTYTMMGEHDDLGLIPLTIKDILNHKQKLIGEKINCELKLSYIEIYNEQVKDLLSSSMEKKCRVREHPITGPYVENANEYELNNFQDFSNYLTRGNSNRATASTSMNDKSSRSHAIITISLKQTKFLSETDSEIIGDAEEEMNSNIKLVDLAGSERLSKTKVYGQQERVKEGNLINKSLTVLGRCINLLANNSSVANTNSPNQQQSRIPYRDSILTYLLKENLAGNSKSFMIFCISPIDFEETYQTLNYANQVKKIKTSAKANKTKLSASPVDWEELRSMDQSAIETLKNEIKELTNKFKTLTASTIEESPTSSMKESDEKTMRLVNYLESESNKLKFENQFLRQKLNDKTSEINELVNHIHYMDNELAEYFHRYKQEQILKQGKLRKELADDIYSLVEVHSKDIDSFLDEFNPKNVF